jgi:hypothetical protein
MAKTIFSIKWEKRVVIFYVTFATKNLKAVVMLRDSPCGGTSKGATVAVTTRGVPQQLETNNIIFSN